MFPQPGWVEVDANEIWRITAGVGRAAIERAGLATKQITAIGITNQRETTVVWDRRTGEPVASAIVWQSRQTAPLVRALDGRGLGQAVKDITGLVLDPYFSATKIRWILDHDDGLQNRAAAGELCFGTIDSWLIWKLTGGLHVTDITNASRTMLFDIDACHWSDHMLSELNIPLALMPQIVGNSGVIGEATGAFAGIPIAGSAGDQHAALFGQACFQTGMAKNTYGTGSFALANIGDAPVRSKHGLLTTLAWQLGEEVTYASEGSILVSGSAVQWLRDGLQIIETSAEIEQLARSVDDSGDVVFVPALAGLGAPDWDASARGLLVGMTRGTTRAHIARATLEAIAFQVADVLDAMAGDTGVDLPELRVDGGASANDLLLQMQADFLGVPVVRSAVQETTALGAGYLAGLGSGVWSDQSQISQQWQSSGTFEPRISADERESRKYRRRAAVARSMHWVNN
jgi:glycerol kinase